MSLSFATKYRFADNLPSEPQLQEEFHQRIYWTCWSSTILNVFRGLYAWSFFCYAERWVATVIQWIDLWTKPYTEKEL